MVCIQTQEGSKALNVLLDVELNKGIKSLKIILIYYLLILLF